MYVESMREIQVNRDKQLDVVRGIAIFCVIAVHTSQVSTITLTAAEYQFSFLDQVGRYSSEFGKYGVELFFFLSGILLAKLYAKRAGFSLRGYAARRLARILPLWYVFTICSLLVYMILDLGWWKGLLGESGGGIGGQLQVAISTFLFMTWVVFPGTAERAVPGGWSIESEMTHYVLFPFFRNFSTVKLIFTIALCGILAALNDLLLENVVVLYDIPARLETLSIFTTFPFFLGGVLAVVWNIDSVKARLTWKYLPFWLFSAVGVVLLVLNQVPFGSFAEAIGFGALAYGTSFIFIKSRILTKAISTVGKYSYFTYFFHFYIVGALLNLHAQIGATPIFGALMETSLAFLILHFAYFSFALLLSQGLGFLSYKYFENPILSWARKIK